MEVMRATRLQTTLARACSVSGRGYWSGEPITVTFVPANAGTGIQFIRSDLPGGPFIRATAANQVSTPLRTRLKQGRAEVDMVEHVMAALYGLRIDNVEVHCTAREMPGLDGSCLGLVLALQSAGRRELEAPRTRLCITEPLEVGEGHESVRIEPTNFPGLEVEYHLDYGQSSPIGQAVFRTPVEPQCFFEQLAPARTFISQQDAQALQRRGIALHVTERDLLVFGEHGPINNTLRFDDECARHKALDLIGDLALTGVDLVGRVIARRSGHQLNGWMAERIWRLHANQFADHAAHDKRSVDAA